MKKIKLFCDGSVNPQQKIGYGAYFIYRDTDTLEIAKQNIQTKKFTDTSSTKLELEVLLWALEDTALLHKEITIYTVILKKIFSTIKINFLCIIYYGKANKKIKN